jgi:replicative DNA helicase
MELATASKFLKDAVNLSDGIDDYILERANNPIEFCGISTGFTLLDKLIDGLVPGTLMVICARPKHGKSTFLSTVSRHVAYLVKKPVLYIDTEMKFDEYRPRILSVLSGVDERKVKHGGYTPQELHNLEQAARLIKTGKLYHEYMPGYSIEKIRTLYKKYKYREDIGLGVFDYIKEPSGENPTSRKEYQLLGDVTTALKDMSGELDIPFLAAVQTSRQQDVADSDRILRYADVLSFFKPKTSEEIEAGGIKAGNYKLVITESRRGGTTDLDGIGFDFVKRCLQIRESAIQHMDFDKHNKEKDDYDDQYEQPNSSTTDESYFV